MRPEVHALAALLDPAPSELSERRLVARLRGPMHWGRLVAAAERSECAPFLLFQLRRRELTDLVPPQHVARLAFAYETTALRNGVLVRDLKQALGALEQRGVAALAVDEAALVARSLYPDRGLRPVSQATLCVGAGEVDRAVEVLISAGYRRICAEQVLANDRGTRVALVAEPWAPGAAGMTLAAGMRSPLDYLASRFAHLAQTEPPKAIRGIDRWFLNVALADHGLRRLRVHVPARRLAEEFGARRFDTLRGTLERRLRGFFPNRDEMVRRHGRRAVGLGLYTLYAGRFLTLQAGHPAAPRRDEPGA